MIMAKSRAAIRLEEWYTNAEAVDVLSKNAGRPINKMYPRTLARDGHIQTVALGTQRLYRKADVDAYVVSTKRGRKPKSQEAAS